MKKSKEGTFFISYELFFRYKGDERGNESYIVDMGKAIDSHGHLQGYKWHKINIFGPEPTYYDRRINVIQVQRISADQSNDGKWLAEVEYVDDAVS